jgi:hypothetical protein
MERVMRIALLSLMGAAAFKVAYVTLYVGDAPERDVMVRPDAESGVLAEPSDDWHRH